jgi:hypothetical protein
MFQNITFELFNLPNLFLQHTIFCLKDRENAGPEILFP